MATLAGLGEFGGGVLLALGLLTPLAPVVITVTMLVAIFTVTSKNGYWATAEGYEYNVAIIAVAIGVALTGPRAYALDAVLFR